MQRLSDLIGRPSVPPEGHAEDAGCQPTIVDAGLTLQRSPRGVPSFPIYRVRKHCPECDLSYLGHSFAWQRDADPATEYPCDTCQYAMDALQRDRRLRDNAAWNAKVNKLAPVKHTHRLAAPARRPESD